MTSNGLNIDGIMLFEQPFVRVSDFCYGQIAHLNFGLGPIRELPEGIPYFAEIYREGAGDIAHCISRPSCESTVRRG